MFSDTGEQMTATKIYVISDLHLGQASQEGVLRPRFCSQSHLLAKFLHQIAEQPLGSAELVINGDFVDFLLPQGKDQPAFVGNPVDAGKRIQKIVEEDEREVFLMLKSIVKRQTLRVLIGNHDLELQFPQVQEYLSKQLGCGLAGLWLSSQPYTPKGAVIVHGNQYDPYNRVDYQSLELYADWCKDQRGTPPSFDPPPGSKLVVDVINPLKLRYPFVDLLKPELGSVVPLLLALEPEYIARLPSSPSPINAGRVQRAVRLFLQALPDMIGLPIRVRMGEISASEQSESITVTDEQIELAMTSAAQAMGEEDTAAFISTLYGSITPTGTNQAEIGFFTGVRQIPGLLGLFLLRHSAPAAYEERLRCLGRALRPLQRDPAFTKDVETDTTLLQAATNLADHYNARFVVFGHTHLAKRVPLPKARDGAERIYLNSGTWADLLQIPDGIFDSNWVRAENCLKDFVESWLVSEKSARDMTSQVTPSALHYVLLVRPEGGAVSSAELHEFNGAAVRLA